MTQYASYNSTVAAPSPVIGWYDTDEFPYPNLPPASDLLLLTAEQWAAHIAATRPLAVSGGALVAYTPPTPTPTLAQQATAALSAGLAITSTSTPALNATYAIDATTQSHMQAEMIALLNSGGTAFADGTATVVWPDMAGVDHTFSTAEGKALFLAAGAYVATLFKCINGTVGTLPPASITIA